MVSQLKKLASFLTGNVPTVDPGISAPTPPIFTTLAPPVPHLLLCNYSPSELEEDSIRIFITQVKEELKRLSTLSRRMPSEEIQHRDLLIKLIRDHEGIVSAFRRLPTELVENIFISVLHFFSDSHGDNTNSITSRYHPFLHGPDSPRAQEGRNPVVFTLSRVCRSWRDIARSFPFLWTRLPTINLDYSPIVSAQQLKVLKIFIQRSKGLPLDIFITAPEIFFDQSPVLSFLFQYSRQWETLRIDAGRSVLQSFQSVMDKLPCLKTLICNNKTRLGNMSLDFFAIFYNAPKLEEVRHSGFLFHDLAVSGFPVQRLLHYSTTLFSSNDIAHNLRSLSITSAGSGLEIDAYDAFVLPSLVQLDLEWDTYPRTDMFSTAFLRLATLPVIEEVRIMLHHDATVILENLRAMLARCLFPAPLQRLFLSSANCEFGTSLALLLEYTPKLIELDTIIPSPSTILQLSSQWSFYAAKFDTPVPLLKSCIFHIHDPLSDQSIEAIKSLINSRCVPIGPRSSTTARNFERLVHFHIEVNLDLDNASRRLRTFHHIRYTTAKLLGMNEIYTASNAFLPHNMTARLLELLYAFQDWRESACTNAPVWKENPEAIVDLLNEILNTSWQPRHIKDILSSNIHVLIYDLARFWHIEDPIRPACWKILATWKALIEDNLNDIEHDWVYDRQSRGRGLYYVPANHPCRESPHRLSAMIIYGLGGESEL